MLVTSLTLSKHTCGVTGCNIKLLPEVGIQALRFPLRPVLKAKQRKFCYAMKLPKVNFNVTFSHLIFDTPIYTHICAHLKATLNTYIFNTRKKRHSHY